MIKPTIRIPLIPAASSIENDDLIIISKTSGDTGGVDKITSINNLTKKLRSSNNLYYFVTSDEDELPKITLRANGDFVSDFQTGDTIRFFLDFDVHVDNEEPLLVSIEKDNNQLLPLEYSLVKNSKEGLIDVTYLHSKAEYEFIFNSESSFTLLSDDWDYGISLQGNNLKITTQLGRSPNLYNGFKLNFKSPKTTAVARLIFDNSLVLPVYSIEDINNQNPSDTNFVTDDYYELVYLDNAWYRTNSVISSIGSEYIVLSTNETHTHYALTSVKGVVTDSYYDGMVINFKCIDSPFFTDGMQSIYIEIDQLGLKKINLRGKDNIACVNFEKNDIITAVYNAIDDCFYANDPLVQRDVIVLDDTLWAEYQTGEVTMPEYLVGKSLEKIANNRYRILKEVPDNEIVLNGSLEEDALNLEKAKKRFGNALVNKKENILNNFMFYFGVNTLDNLKYLDISIDTFNILECFNNEYSLSLTTLINELLSKYPDVNDYSFIRLHINRQKDILQFYQQKSDFYLNKNNKFIINNDANPIYKQIILDKIIIVIYEGCYTIDNSKEELYSKSNFVKFDFINNTTNGALDVVFPVIINYTNIFATLRPSIVNMLDLFTINYTFSDNFSLYKLNCINFQNHRTANDYRYIYNCKFNITGHSLWKKPSSIFIDNFEVNKNINIDEMSSDMLRYYLKTIGIDTFYLADYISLINVSISIKSLIPISVVNNSIKTKIISSSCALDINNLNIECSLEHTISGITFSPSNSIRELYLPNIFTAYQINNKCIVKFNPNVFGKVKYKHYISNRNNVYNDTLTQEQIADLIKTAADKKQNISFNHDLYGVIIKNNNIEITEIKENYPFVFHFDLFNQSILIKYESNKLLNVLYRGISVSIGVQSFSFLNIDNVYKYKDHHYFLLMSPIYSTYKIQ